MHDIADTIVAVSSSAGGVRSILRIGGPQALSICEQVFEPDRASQIPDLGSRIGEFAAVKHPVLLSGSVRITAALAVDARLYLFFAPHSYTGEHLAEFHVYASQVLVEALVQKLLAVGLRPAGPGEFTARAYLNGKLDLAQAEAVNEIISSSNRLQLDAAERLLSGRLTHAADRIRSDLLDVLSLIEAGLDFSGEDIEFISNEQAVERLVGIQASLEQLLAGSIQYETLIDLPAIGIAGAPNAGKSSLLNALLGWERSIASDQPGTTRDVLNGILTTDRFQCVLFDCAGLLRAAAPECGTGIHAASRIDELAQQAAIEALRSCRAVIFCVDSAKSDWAEDIAIRTLIQPKSLIHVATKSDLLPSEGLRRRLDALAGAFDAEFLPVSAKARQGLHDLLDSLERTIVGWAVSDAPPFLAMTARHKQAVADAVESIRQSIEEVCLGSEEIAVTTIRAACAAISQIERQHIDEEVLDRIFSRFCIGK
jgi:tRNA modification GTPase